MAKVWFVRRRGGQWIAPGGVPVCDAPLAQILFALDLGPHRRLDDEDGPIAAPELEKEPVESLKRVLVELSCEDIRNRTFSAYRPGLYDSALSPAAAAARLAKLTLGAPSGSATEAATGAK